MIYTLLKDATIYTDWLPREGDYAIFAAQCLARDGATVTIEIFHKSSNAESSMDGTDTTKEITLSSVGVATIDMGASTAVALRELVRFKLTATGTNASDWAIVKILAPSWYNRGNG